MRRFNVRGRRALTLKPRNSLTQAGEFWSSKRFRSAKGLSVEAIEDGEVVGGVVVDVIWHFDEDAEAIQKTQLRIGEIWAEGHRMLAAFSAVRDV